MSQTISISVTEKRLSTDCREVITHNGNYLLSFTFDGEWAEFTQKVVVLRWEDGGAETLLNGTQCAMPTVIAKGDYFEIGVYAVKETQRIASNWLKIRCIEGAFSQEYVQSEEDLTLRDEVISLINGKDWSIFNDKTTAGEYSAVTVNEKGFVTSGKHVLEVGAVGATSPVKNLMTGGIFIGRNVSGQATLSCKENGGGMQSLTFTNVKLPKKLKFGQKSFDGSAELMITKQDLGVIDPVTPVDPYPVGSIYMSVASTSPASLFGGTWEQMQTGRVLISANATHALGSTGGSETVALTLTQIPRHKHSINFSYASADGGNNLRGTSSGTAAYGKYTGLVGGTDGGSEGSCSAHENMPPYLAVNMWKRTA